MRAVILIDRLTGELDGVTIVSNDADADHVQSTDAHDVLDVPLDHPALSEQGEWRAHKVSGGYQLRRKNIDFMSQQKGRR